MGVQARVEGAKDFCKVLIDQRWRRSDLSHQHGCFSAFMPRRTYSESQMPVSASRIELSVVIFCHSKNLHKHCLFGKCSRPLGDLWGDLSRGSFGSDHESLPFTYILKFFDVISQSTPTQTTNSVHWLRTKQGALVDRLILRTLGSV